MPIPIPIPRDLHSESPNGIKCKRNLRGRQYGMIHQSLDPGGGGAERGVIGGIFKHLKDCKLLQILLVLLLLHAQFLPKTVLH